MADNQQLKRQMEKLSAELEFLDKRFRYPLDEDLQVSLRRVVQRFLPEDIPGIFSRNVIEYHTLFESLSGFGKTETTGGNISIGGSKLDVATDATNGDVSRLQKTPSKHKSFTFAGESRIVTALELDNVSNQTTYIGVGDSQSGSFYGFKADGSSLQGATHDGTSENTVDLLTISNSTLYGLEARYIPGGGVVFLVDNEEVGASDSNIPNPARSANTNLIDIRVETGENVAKTLSVSHFAYTQRKFEL